LTTTKIPIQTLSRPPLPTHTIQHGVGFVVAKNSTHYGIAGYYATMASSSGCIGFTGTNARPSIAPTFGVEPMLGTNPLCFGIPSDDEFPFVIDCATSVNQRGKIERYAREGKDTPKGCVIDNDGIERTDTEGILKDMVLGKVRRGEERKARTTGGG
jgi:L-2-hydroxycarboxylate dehydrogenase (NAD+)